MEPDGGMQAVMQKQSVRGRQRESYTQECRQAGAFKQAYKQAHKRKSKDRSA
jgi:hypothetical protein